MVFICFVFIFVRLAIGWANIPHIDLIWPPIKAQVDVIVDEQTVSPENANAPSAFPCAMLPIPPNVERQPFPMDGGRFQVNFAGAESAFSRSDIGKWHVKLYFGQYNGNTTVSLHNWTYISVYAWNSTRFELGTWCSDPFSLLYRIEQSGMPAEFRDGRSLDGVNATIGLRIVRFSEDRTATRDQMLQGI
jgi:hypothetical protein